MQMPRDVERAILTPKDVQQEIQQLLNQLEDALTRSHMEPVD